MILSLITGTFNRLSALQRMIGSARSQLPRGLSYELIVVDGGSTDGTLEWCRAQPDMRLIEHGELRGAIKAFCDGARAAQGDYVVLANDDVIFKPFGLLAAIAHLETNPTCGAVAFSDNRTSLVHGDGSAYRVEGVSATAPDGSPTMVYYAQVGMFHRWLGDKVGWWGDQDAIMGRARTYGGDNFLSASIWEAGYTVDAVPQAVVQDYIARDDLRDSNARSGNYDSACYYRRFPTIHLPARLANPPHTERLRILNLPIYELAYPGRRNREAGLTEALAGYGLAIEWDTVNEPVDLVALAKAWQPDLVIMQMQAADRLTLHQIADLRRNVPGALICNFNGDAHESGLIAPPMLDVLRYVDLQTTVNAQVLPVYAAEGIPAAYWQIGYKDPVDPLPDVPAFDVLFQGNCYSDARRDLIDTLRRVRVDGHPVQVGVFGNCPGAHGNSHYNFAMQRALYQRATITIGDTYPGTQAFVSNRLFQALAAGAFLLQQHSEGLQDYTGLIPGEHYVEWHDLDDLSEAIVTWLSPVREAWRARIAAQGRDFVRANFSYPAQARKLFEELLPKIAEVARVSA